MMGVLRGRSLFLLYWKGWPVLELNSIHDYLSAGFEIGAVQKSLKEEQRPPMIYNLTGSQKAAFTAQLLRRAQKPALILTYSEEQAQKWTNDLLTWLPEEKIMLFPTTEWLPFEVLGRSKETTAERIRVLKSLIQDNSCTVVASVLAVERRLFSPAGWRQHCLEFRVGFSYVVEEILRNLITMGYERVQSVEGKGQFALRGGILDIAPLESEPVRLEFFDEEIDSIRLFDLETQKSVTVLEEVLIVPVLEYVLTAEQLQQLGGELRSQSRKAISRLKRSGRKVEARRLDEKTENLQARLQQGILDENIYSFLGLVQADFEDFFSYLSPQRLVILDEPLRLQEQLDFQEKERMEEFTQQLERGEAFVNPAEQFITYDHILKYGQEQLLLGFSTLLRQAPGLTNPQVFNQTARSLTGFTGKTGLLAEEIEHWQTAGNVVALFAGDEEHALRLIQGLKDRGVSARPASLTAEICRGQVLVYACSLEQGFELPLSRIIILTETEIYKRERKAPARRAPSREQALPRLQFSDLRPGDFVVHVHHGIGRFNGIEKISVSGVEKDYFALHYAGTDRLYVPVDQLHLLRKYLGAAADALPKLYKLGGSEWQKVKSKAKNAIKEMAIDLVGLYAKREASTGFAFSADNVWQTEFEEKFPYEETPDQRQCIAEVKQDMMRPRPMDRLLCGDVGYGKTEVALRAACKAVLDSKQVAVLVPTTILAQQHFNTFRERFSSYPVGLEMLSRFRSAREQKAIIAGLKAGSVDIVIGTHRLLAEGLKFKDLGLLIIDEEQRFGVAHKEKLKELKTTVDVLTLTATPIPRTLHMSLIGVRDMSIIETPPEDRYPVQTYVMEFRPDLVRDALRREIQRGGQGFYVHNRVEDMEQVVHFLNQLVPEARCGIAHGQMSEVLLEKEMLAFLEKEKDILVCTTIIETGLDMPNVNTLILDEADRLGLAQLYQLRGRVGRSNRKAFAYFLYKPRKILSELAEKRLSAIRDFTEFGSGFKIALRDLEIRGAGNIIGAQQHGQLAAIGFDLYCQMLQEAVRELRGESIEVTVEPSIELQVEALLPDSYIPEQQTKSSLYQRLAMISDEDALGEMLDELIDRFGTPPAEVENLLQIIRIKWLAASLKIEQIQQVKHNVNISFAADPGLDGEQLMAMAAASPAPLSFGTTAGGNLTCHIRLRLSGQAEILQAVSGVLKAFCGIACQLTP
jgi:transcription-repair coupling factor (superfamily II helicase)